MKKLVIATLFVIGSVAVAASVANANVLGEQEQKQELQQSGSSKCNPKITTTTGSYGTTTTTVDGNCEVNLNQSASQEQRQQIFGEQVVMKDERVNKVHIPANTALDTKSMIAAVSISAIGGFAFALRKKIV